MHNQPVDTESLENYVKKWGNSASIALLDPKFSIFKDPKIDGVIGYRTAGNMAIVSGDPVCDPSAKIELAKAFANYCAQNNRHVVYTQISEDFANWAQDHYNGSVMEIGDDLYVNPQNDPTADGNNGRLLRKKINKATQEGLRVFEYTDEVDLEIEKAMDKVKEDWLKDRKGPQIFLSHIYLFNSRENKRWFYARQRNKIVGICMLSRLDARGGWVINCLMASPEAPSGTTELLVVSVMETLRGEGCQYLTFGMIPCRNLRNIKGLGCLSKALAQTIFNSARWMFNLDGKRPFWSKFKPIEEKSHVLMAKSGIKISDVLSILSAMNARL